MASLSVDEVRRWLDEPDGRWCGEIVTVEGVLLQLNDVEFALFADWKRFRRWASKRRRFRVDESGRRRPVAPGARRPRDVLRVGDPGVLPAIEDASSTTDLPSNIPFGWLYEARLRGRLGWYEDATGRRRAGVDRVDALTLCVEGVVEGEWWDYEVIY